MSNKEQNRQFAEAVRQLEQEFGRKLTPDQKRRLHEEISGQGLKTMEEIVEWGRALFF